MGLCPWAGCLTLAPRSALKSQHGSHCRFHNLLPCDRPPVPCRLEAPRSEQVGQTSNVLLRSLKSGSWSVWQCHHLLSIINAVGRIYNRISRSIEDVVITRTVSQTGLVISPNTSQATITPELRIEDEHRGQHPGFVCKIGQIFPVRFLSQTQCSEACSIFDVATVCACGSVSALRGVIEPCLVPQKQFTYQAHVANQRAPVRTRCLPYTPCEAVGGVYELHLDLFGVRKLCGSVP